MAQESSQKRTETVKPGDMSKEDQGKLIKNYVRLVAELLTTDIADYFLFFNWFVIKKLIHYNSENVNRLL
jgi:hypothetical protein